MSLTTFVEYELGTWLATTLPSVSEISSLGSCWTTLLTLPSATSPRNESGPPAYGIVFSWVDGAIVYSRAAVPTTRISITMPFRRKRVFKEESLHVGCGRAHPGHPGRL